MSAKSRSSSDPNDRRMCQPNGRPACSQVRECQGPAHTTNRYVAIGGVVENVRTSPSRPVSRPLATTVQSAGAVTVSEIGALRSGWSKQAKTFRAMSMPSRAET